MRAWRACVSWSVVSGCATSARLLARLPTANRDAVVRSVQTVDEVSERYERYDYNAAGVAAYNFLWDEFADWAIEASKASVVM